MFSRFLLTVSLTYFNHDFERIKGIKMLTFQKIIKHIYLLLKQDNGPNNYANFSVIAFLKMTLFYWSAMTGSGLIFIF